MAVASKSAVSGRKSQATPKSKAVVGLNAGVTPLPLQVKGTPSRPQPNSRVPILLSSNPAPLWLLRLCSLQRRSLVVLFLLVAGMLASYGWTVYSQQKWTQAYRKLEILQRNERQLTITNEVLKNQLALQAEQADTHLLPSAPELTIFLQPAPQAASPNATSIAVNTEATAKLTPLPVGY